MAQLDPKANVSNQGDTGIRNERTNLRAIVPDSKSQMAIDRMRDLLIHEKTDGPIKVATNKSGIQSIEILPADDCFTVSITKNVRGVKTHENLTFDQNGNCIDGAASKDKTLARTISTIQSTLQSEHTKAFQEEFRNATRKFLNTFAKYGDPSDVPEIVKDMSLAQRKAFANYLTGQGLKDFRGQDTKAMQNLAHQINIQTVYHNAVSGS